MRSSYHTVQTTFRWSWPLLCGLGLALLCACSQDVMTSGADADLGDTTPAGTLVATATAGPLGGTLVSPDGRFKVQVPPDALTEMTELRLYRMQEATPKADRAASDPWLVPATWYTVEPADLALKKNAWVRAEFQQVESPLTVMVADVALFRRPSGQAWLPLETTETTASAKYYPDILTVEGYTATLGELAVRIRAPYEKPPALVQVGLQTPISTVEGPLLTIAPYGTLDLWGSGFGWDPTHVKVTIGEQEQKALLVQNRYLQVQLSIPQPKVDVELPVVVHVDSLSSNVLVVRFQGLVPGIAEITDVYPTGGAAVGQRFRMDGKWYGSEETLRVRIGDRVVIPKRENGSLVVTVPDDVTPGSVELRVDDGLGSDLSNPWPYLIFPLAPPVLSAGLEAGGVWLPTDPSPPAEYAALEMNTVDVVLDVAGLEPYLSASSQLSVRFWSAAHDTGWQDVKTASNLPPPCQGLPTGRCVLRLPPPVVQGLLPGDKFQVQIRMRQKLLTGDAPPDDFLVRDSAPLELKVAGRPVPGSLARMQIGKGDTGFQEVFCSAEAQPLSVGDVLCLRVNLGCGAEGKDCAPLQKITAPDLWPGELTWGAGVQANQGIQQRCVPMTQAGLLPLTNLTTGQSCQVHVVNAGGRYMAGQVSAVDPSKPLVLAMGGGRVIVPAGALPPLDPESATPLYTIEAWAPLPGDPKNPPVQSGDPQKASALGLYSLKITPEPKELLLPVSLDLPLSSELAVKQPSLGLIDTATGLIHTCKAELDAVAMRLKWELPAGQYAKPTGPAQPGDPALALPDSFNTAVASIGVLYRKDTPGVLEDALGHFRLDYVVDPASADYATETYAATVLDAAVNAWETLAALGWRVPKGPIDLSLRKSVSWADFSGKAKGATTSGFLGQPGIVVQNGVADAELATIVTHEVGHLFQRQYTVNLTLSWLDEAMAEWTAFQVLGADFQLQGMTEDGAAAKVVTSGLPDGWGAVAADFVYGSSAWLNWLTWKQGPDPVRKLYEALDWNPANWTSAYATLATVGDKPVGELLRDFAEDFWLQRFDPVSKVSASALLDAAGFDGSMMFAGVLGATKFLAERPALSSMRYAMKITNEQAAMVATGEAVLRVTGLGPEADVSVWTQPNFTMDADNPTLVARLDEAHPLQVLTQVTAGSWWLVHNRWATSGSVGGKLTLELPRISALQPGAAKPAALLTISGQQFGAGKGDVFIGGVQAVVQTWSTSLVVVKVPTLPAGSPAAVRVRTLDQANSNPVLLQVL
jgi:hypothetical protein